MFDGLALLVSIFDRLMCMLLYFIMVDMAIRENGSKIMAIMLQSGGGFEPLISKI